MGEYGKRRQLNPIQPLLGCCNLYGASCDGDTARGKIIFIRLAVDHGRNRGIPQVVLQGGKLHNLNHGLGRTVFLVRIVHRDISLAPRHHHIIDTIGNKVAAGRHQRNRALDQGMVRVGYVDDIELRDATLAGHIRHIGPVSFHKQSVGDAQCVQGCHNRHRGIGYVSYHQALMGCGNKGEVPEDNHISCVPVGLDITHMVRRG